MAARVDIMSVKNKIGARQMMVCGCDVSFPAKGGSGVFDWQIASSRECFVPLSENKKV